MIPIHFPVFVVPMPLNKNGEGPANPSETVVNTFEVWDGVHNTICCCIDIDIAQRIADLLNGKFRETPVARKPYSCPVCLTGNPEQYRTCNLPLCPDGRDPR